MWILHRYYDIDTMPYFQVMIFIFGKCSYANLEVSNALNYIHRKKGWERYYYWSEDLVMCLCSFVDQPIFIIKLVSLLNKERYYGRYIGEVLDRYALKQSKKCDCSSFLFDDFIYVDNLGKQ